MERPSHEAIEIIMGITGVSEVVAAQKLEEHWGDLNAAINAHFTGDRSTIHETCIGAPHNAAMDIDDHLSLVCYDFGRSLWDSGPDFTSSSPIVSHSREVEEIPTMVSHGTEQSSNSVLTPTIDGFSGTSHAVAPEIHGAGVTDGDIPIAFSGDTAARNEKKDDVLHNSSHNTCPRPSAPRIDDYSSDIEEEMIRAAVEASRREAGIGYLDQQRQSLIEDVELEEAVSLSLKTAEQEKALRVLGKKVGDSELDTHKSNVFGDLGKRTALNERSEVGSSSSKYEAPNVEEQSLVRHRRRLVSSSSVDSTTEIEWGGISSEKHDEAIMHEAALVVGIPGRKWVSFPYAPHQLIQNSFDRTSGLHPQRTLQFPSPSFDALHLVKGQQDDEYLPSVEADREKELKVRGEAEARRLEVHTVRGASHEEERQKEEASCRKSAEEQGIRSQLTAKEASLPPEPTSNDENELTLQVRMPDGSRNSCRFAKADKLQSVFDFIDVGGWVKPSSYRLVRSYPRRAFSDGEIALALNELGFTGKEEVIFLELI